MLGWKCPSCSRCWSPDTRGCLECNKAEARPAIQPQKLTPFLPPVFHPAPIWNPPVETPMLGHLIVGGNPCVTISGKTQGQCNN